MKKIILMIAIMIVFLTSVSGQTVPEDVSTVTINKIDIEHKNTRQYFKNEFDSQRQKMFKDFDDRAEYYEGQFHSIIRTAVIKLGILWLGVTMFVVFINNFIRNKIEKKKYGILKDSLKKDLMMELAPTRYKISQEDIKFVKKDIFSTKFKEVV